MSSIRGQSISGLPRALTPTATVLGLGSGTQSGVYYKPVGCSYLRVRMVGGGGGGAGSGTSGSGGSGTNGGITWFGSVSYLQAGSGGGGDTSVGNGGSGGFATTVQGSPSLVVVAALSGSTGTGWTALQAGTTNYDLAGAPGGMSPFGSCGGGGRNGAVGVTSSNNGGSGGGGAGTSGIALSFNGSGGGAGAYIEALLTNPATTYLWQTGGGGPGGTAGTSGFAGGAGGSGMIIIEEYYQ